MRKNVTRPRNLRAKERARAAVTLRLSGKTYDQIAEEVGYAGRGSAYEAVQGELAERKKLADGEADKLRTIELERLDMLLDLAMKAARSGDTKAVATALRIAESRRKLLGIDAPTRQEVTGPNGSPLVQGVPLALREMSEDELRAQLEQALNQIKGDK